LTFRVSFVGFFFSTFLEYIISFRAEEERRLASKNICLVYLIASLKNPIFDRFPVFYNITESMNKKKMEKQR